MTTTDATVRAPAWEGRAEVFSLSPEVRAVAEETVATRRHLRRQRCYFGSAAVSSG